MPITKQTKDVWKTSDGREFFSETDATNHELGGALAAKLAQTCAYIDDTRTRLAYSLPVAMLAHAYDLSPILSAVVASEGVYAAVHSAPIIRRGYDVKGPA